MKNCNSPSTPAEFDAFSIDIWSRLLKYEREIKEDISNINKLDKTTLQSIDDSIRNLGDNLDIDIMLAWVRAKEFMGSKTEAINILNQVFN